MRRYRLCLSVALLALLTPFVRAEPRAPRVVLDTWDAAYLEGAKNGHAHTTVQEIDRGGKKTYRTTLEMVLLIRRYDAAVPVRFVTSTDETPEGKVLGLSQ